MPTENRSSNTEMVIHQDSFKGDNKALVSSISSLLALDAKGSLVPHGIGGHARVLLASSAARLAEQPHADPIAWMVGTAFWWTKEEAERDAAATGLPIVGLGPMTCSTEVEQLREVIKHSDAQIMRQSMRISNQRTQLAEAQALLREADEFMYIMTAHDGHAKLAHRYGKDWWDAIDKLRGMVCTALSASAEPQVKS